MPTKAQLHRQWEIDFKYPEFRRDGDPMKATFRQAERRRKEMWPDEFVDKKGKTDKLGKRKII